MAKNRQRKVDANGIEAHARSVPMNKKLSDADIITAHDLHARGMTWKAIGEKFGVTAETVRKRCADAPRPPPEPDEVPVEDVIAEAEAALEDESSTEGILDGQIRIVRAAQRKATTEAAQLTCARLIGSLAAQRHKMKPPPAPDLNERPDYQRAAAEVRAKLHELLDRAMAGSE
jgi:hypothetical protein